MTGQAEYTVRRGYVMSEHEKFEQVGRLAEEVSHIKGDLNQIIEKLQRAFLAYVRLSQSGSFQNWKALDGKLHIPATNQYPQQNTDFGGLLNEHQLIEVLEHKQKLERELNAALERLKGLAPHLF